MNLSSISSLVILCMLLLAPLTAQDAAPKDTEAQRIERMAAETIADAEARLAELSPEAQASMHGPMLRALLGGIVGPHLLDAEAVPPAHLAAAWPKLLEVLYGRGYKTNSLTMTNLEQTAHDLFARYRLKEYNPEERTTLEAVLQTALVLCYDGHNKERVILAQECLTILRKKYPTPAEDERSLIDWRTHGDDWDMALEYMLTANRDAAPLDRETFTEGITLEIEGDPPTDTPKPDTSKMSRDEVLRATHAQILAIRYARGQRTQDRSAVLAYLESQGKL